MDALIIDRCVGEVQQKKNFFKKKVLCGTKQAGGRIMKN